MMIGGPETDEQCGSAPRRLRGAMLSAAVGEGLLDPFIAGKALPPGKSHIEKLKDAEEMKRQVLRAQSLAGFLKKQRLTPPHGCASCGKTISANKTKCGACATAAASSSVPASLRD